MPRRAAISSGSSPSRGEHTKRSSTGAVFCGSSPLAQGTHENRHHPSPASRLIPARAGNTPPCDSSTRRSPAHPRSRGEHGNRRGTGPANRGSSPLARGTRDAVLDKVPFVRLIPAREGNTSEPTLMRSATPAHPRSRGDHTGYEGSVVHRLGSSPLARGPLMNEPPKNRTDGLIPARAGTTLVYSCTRGRSGAHPRSRGDHNRFRVLAEERLGSSPLARGPQCTSRAPKQGAGLIPARAGTTRKNEEWQATHWAHPRSRGDHRDLKLLKFMAGGSSPLARGPPS